VRADRNRVPAPQTLDDSVARWSERRGNPPRVRPRRLLDREALDLDGRQHLLETRRARSHERHSTQSTHWPRAGENLAQYRRAVGHDAVDAEIEESDHLVAVVDGPDVNLHSAVVRLVEEPRVDERDPLGAGGHLRAWRGQTSNGHAVGRTPQSCDAPRPERCARRGTQQRANAGQPPIAEGSDADPIDRVTALQHIDERGYGAIVFRVDVHPDVGERAEELLEQRDGFTSVHLCVLHHRPGKGIDAATSVGDAIQHVVMEREQDAVSGHMHVGLDVAVAEPHGMLERGASCSRALPMRRPGERRRSVRASRGTRTRASCGTLEDEPVCVGVRHAPIRPVGGGARSPTAAATARTRCATRQTSLRSRRSSLGGAVRAGTLPDTDRRLLADCR